MLLAYYTKINVLLCFLYACCPHPSLGTFLFINSHAIFASFHAAELFMPGSFRRFAAKHSETYGWWWLKTNIAGHYAPLLLSHTWMQIDSANAMRIGVLSTIVHLAWALVVHGTLYMDEPYVYMHPWVWRRMWTVALLTHVSCGAALQMIKHKDTTH